MAAGLVAGPGFAAGLAAGDLAEAEVKTGVFGAGGFTGAGLARAEAVVAGLAARAFGAAGGTVTGFAWPGRAAGFAAAAAGLALAGFALAGFAGAGLGAAGFAAWAFAPAGFGDAGLPVADFGAAGFAAAARGTAGFAAGLRGLVGLALRRGVTTCLALATGGLALVAVPEGVRFRFRVGVLARAGAFMPDNSPAALPGRVADRASCAPTRFGQTMSAARDPSGAGPGRAAPPPRAPIRGKSFAAVSQNATGRRLTPTSAIKLKA
ncbi:hypothetical protein [Siccirubricoccus phaeus]|uniref:hypothetical protein n=1 Tax=Siccirubricoccus phaeus TaxID=2595053 RepID=UPI0011F1BA69|nr:hypothetical protein [Siccirubricoccus phaeus]